MDRQLIETLIDTLERSGLSELEFSRDGDRLRLVKGGPTPATPPAALPVVPVQAAPPRSASPDRSGGSVAAPLYGVVHLRPAPDSDPFVAVGQEVAPGQVLCTIEAMKVFTEIRADRAGTVDAILVAGGQEVEPGQALVRLA